MCVYVYIGLPRYIYTRTAIFFSFQELDDLRALGIPAGFEGPCLNKYGLRTSTVGTIRLRARTVIQQGPEQLSGGTANLVRDIYIYSHFYIYIYIHTYTYTYTYLYALLFNKGRNKWVAAPPIWYDYIYIIYRYIHTYIHIHIHIHT